MHQSDVLSGMSKSFTNISFIDAFFIFMSHVAIFSDKFSIIIIGTTRSFTEETEGQERNDGRCEKISER